MDRERKQPSKAEAGSSSAKCLTPDCQQPAKYVGLCRPCHEQALTAISRGEITRAEAEARGLILPTQRGRPRGKWTRHLYAVLEQSQESEATTKEPQPI